MKKPNQRLSAQCAAFVRRLAKMHCSREPYFVCTTAYNKSQWCFTCQARDLLRRKGKKP